MTTNRWCLGRDNALNKVNGQLEPLNQSHTAATVASSKSFRDNCRQRGVERGGLQPFGIHQHVGQICSKNLITIDQQDNNLPSH